jgi:hypothetical protein
MTTEFEVAASAPVAPKILADATDVVDSQGIVAIHCVKVVCGLWSGGTALHQVGR